VRLGIVARSDDRGLGNQTWEACRHLHPDRVLLIEPEHDKRFTQHPERYDQFDTTRASWRSGRLNEMLCRGWLRGLDVVYTAEAYYDPRFPEWAQSERVPVVVHANPEFMPPSAVTVPSVAWWTATPWRLAHLPPATRIVPMPVPACPIQRDESERLRFLHVAGWPAVGDRNGTEIVAEAAMRLAVPCDVIIRGQHPQLANGRRYRRRTRPVRLTIESNSVPDYWSLYRDADILVMPRRFGGLCLPVQEAMSAGLATIMPDCSPNQIWPGARLPARARASVRTPAGNIPLHDVDPRVLAESMGELVTDRELVRKLQREATEWAQANSWQALRPVWMRELEAACR
jgi:Glycosyl transferases group 1